MLRNRILTLAAFGALLFSVQLQAADQPNAAEVKLRETLRNTMLQLRTAQNDNASLQAAKTEQEGKNKDLETQVKQLTQRSVEDRDAAKKKEDDLTAKVTALTTKLDQLRTEYDRSQANLQAVTVLAQSKEAERKKLEGDRLGLDRTVADQKTKNSELYKLAVDILRRYERMGLGEALSAKEPFVGTKRVKLESYVQDFQDKLTDQKIKP
ncbi:MAG: phage major capsid protein [Chthoniobacteraceae bacterium]